jgi:hypothetical protein
MYVFAAAVDAFYRFYLILAQGLSAGEQQHFVIRTVDVMRNDHAVI